MRISDWSSDVCSSDLAPICPATSARWWPGRSGQARLAASPLIVEPSPRHSSTASTSSHRATAAVMPLSSPSLIARSEEHTSELQSLMRISYAVFCLKKKKKNKEMNNEHYDD